MNKHISCDFFVAGAGLSGIAAAVTAGRLGLDTIICEKEMFLGGNAGPNLGVAPTAAMITNDFVNEMGFVEELEEEISWNYLRMKPTIFGYNINPQLDTLYMKLLREAHVKVLRKHVVLDTVKDGDRIVSIILLDLETMYKIQVDVKNSAIDCTGDAMLARAAGADVVMGREARSETGERNAPEVRDDIISTASLTAIAVDTGVDVPFVAPEGTPDWNPAKSDSHFNPDHKVHFLWQVDEGGESFDNHPFYTSQALWERLVSRIYSQWNYVKNIKYKDKLKTHQLIWISPILGKRESWRIMGDYLLTQTDIESCREFDDAVGFGGSYLDEHLPSFDGGYEVVYNYQPLPYDIPYRCIYSRNVSNLFAGGRTISSSHMAFTSTRLMRTCCILAQAAAIAARLRADKNCSIREVSEKYLEEYRANLLANDVQLFKAVSEEANLLYGSVITASSFACSTHLKNEKEISTEHITFDIYEYPEKLDGLSFKMSSKYGATLNVEIHYCQTQNPVTVISPRNYWDKDKKKFIVETGKPPISDSGVPGIYNYYSRNDALADSLCLCTRTIHLEPGYNGDVLLENLDIVDIPNYRRQLFGQAVRVVITSDKPVSITCGYSGLDNAELFIDGEFQNEILPYYTMTPAVVGGIPANICSGMIHRVGRAKLNSWISDPTKEFPQWISASFECEKKISDVKIFFDITSRKWHDMHNITGERVSPRLVKKFRLEFLDGNRVIETVEMDDNHNRFVHIPLKDVVESNGFRMVILETWSGGPVRINRILLS